MRHPIGPVGRRINSRGQLVLVAPYRWDPALVGMTVPQLRDVASGRDKADWYSYRAQCARDELDRRAPRTASLCYDVKKGWEPLTDPQG